MYHLANDIVLLSKDFSLYFFYILIVRKVFTEHEDTSLLIYKINQ